MKQQTKKCKHQGDKNNFHPQYCTLCGDEFMYDILSSNLNWKNRWFKSFNSTESQKLRERMWRNTDYFIAGRYDLIR